MSAAITATVITVGAGMVMANQARKAASGAANAQAAAAQAGIAEQKSQFEAMQQLLQPYVQAGNLGLTGMADLNGMNGPEAQKKALDALQASPQFASMIQQGENSILQNASATGGLRGGNTQAALAQFRPQVLTSLIDQQYQRLGGLAQLGQASAAGVGAAGMQTGRDTASLLGQIGQYQAGGILGGAQANQMAINSLLQGFGQYGRSQGWSAFGGAGTQPPAGYGGDWSGAVPMGTNGAWYTPIKRG